MEFKISSALKNLIGRELITNDLVAIFELVKNSYDAGAKEVKIIFENIKENNSKDGKIYILDNGSGMSKKDIENKWLFLGYSEKKFTEKDLENVDFRDKINSKRIFAGAKGIGRFSCDRLSSKLNIYTKKDIPNLLYINWDNFEEDQNKEFHNIPIEFHENINLPEKLNSKSGTLLELSDLRDGWDFKKLQQLKRYLQRLLNPLNVNVNDEFKIILEAREFIDEDNSENFDYNIVNGLIENVVYEKLKVKTTMIDCNISSDGSEIITRLEDKGIFIYEFREKNIFNQLKNINIRLSYLSKEAKTTFTKIMGIQPVNFGSLFLFKNSFRVLPYGEFEDDWLGLDVRKTQRHSSLLGTREILGRIEINGFQPEFREVTSRSEGLEKTLAFYELKEFIIEKVIKILEKYVVNAIDWDSPRDNPNSDKIRKSEIDKKKDTLKLIQKLTGDSTKENVEYNKNFLEIFEDKQIEKIPQQIKNLEEQVKQEKDPLKKFELEKISKNLKSSILSKDKKTKEEKEYITKEKEEEKEKRKNFELENNVLKTSNQFLKDLNSQSKDEIYRKLHHIKAHTQTSMDLISNLFNILNKNKSGDPIKILEKISTFNKNIFSITNIITEGGAHGMSESNELDVVQVFHNYLNNMYGKKYDSILTIHIINDSNIIFKKVIDTYDFAYIIDNFLSNSRKSKAKNIYFTFKLIHDDLEIIIQDDGNGLDKKKVNYDSIFEPGITSKWGSGLGLFDVKTSINELNGTIEASDDDIYSIRFKLVIRR